MANNKGFTNVFLPSRSRKRKINCPALTDGVIESAKKEYFDNGGEVTKIEKITSHAKLSYGASCNDFLTESPVQAVRAVIGG